MFTLFVITAIIAVACFIYAEWHIKDEDCFFNTDRGEIVLYIIFFIPIIIFSIFTQINIH